MKQAELAEALRRIADNQDLTLFSRTLGRCCAHALFEGRIPVMEITILRLSTHRTDKSRETGELDSITDRRLLDAALVAAADVAQAEGGTRDARSSVATRSLVAAVGHDLLLNAGELLERSETGLAFLDLAQGLAILGDTDAEYGPKIREETARQLAALIAIMQEAYALRLP